MFDDVLFTKITNDNDKCIYKVQLKRKYYFF